MVTQFTMITGDSRTLQIAIMDESGTTVDVSTAQAIEYGIYENNGTVRLTKTLGFGITVAAHVVTVELLPSDTADILGGNYQHEMEIITASGSVHTVLQGAILMKRDFIKR